MFLEVKTIGKVPSGVGDLSCRAAERRSWETDGGHGLGLGAAQGPGEQAFMVRSWGKGRACLGGGRAGWRARVAGMTLGWGAAHMWRLWAGARLKQAGLEAPWRRQPRAWARSWTECGRLWGLGCPLSSCPQLVLGQPGRQGLPIFGGCHRGTWASLWVDSQP